MNYFKSSITSIVLLLIFLMPTTSHAAIDSLWSKVYDYCEEMHTYGSMAKTNDGNFLMLPSCGPNLEGNNYTHDYSGAIIKINSEGDTLWTNYVNLWDGYDTFWRGFIEFDNGEFLFTSHIQYPNGYKYPVLIRTDSIGDTLWTKHFYSDSTNNMYMSDPIHNNENNYYYSGGTTLGSNELNAWIVEIDATNGDSLMQSYYGDSTSQYFLRLYKLEDGSFIAAGNQTDSNDNRNFWLVKLDELLNVVWEKSYGGDGYDSMAKLIINTNGDYTMVGRTESFGEGGQDGYVVRTDSDGTVLWDTTFGGVDTDRFYDVIETVDNNLLLAGYSKSYGDQAYWVVKINESGALIDERLFDSQYNDKGTGIIATSYDEFIIYGLRYHGGYEEPTDTWLVKFSFIENRSLSGNIGGMTLTPDEEWLVLDSVWVEDGDTLTILPGTIIKFTPGIDAYMLIKRGGYIHAQGTEDDPILFTSASEDPKSDDWLGFQILGKGPGQDPFWEVQDDHNAGVLQYINIEYSQYGFGLVNIGSGTGVNFITHSFSGTGYYIHGGNASFHHLAAVGIWGTAFYITGGYTSGLSEIFINGAERGISVRNTHGAYWDYDEQVDPDTEPRTEPTISQLTMTNVQGLTLEFKNGGVGEVNNTIIYDYGWDWGGIRVSSSSGHVIDQITVDNIQHDRSHDYGLTNNSLAEQVVTNIVDYVDPAFDGFVPTNSDDRGAMLGGDWLSTWGHTLELSDIAHVFLTYPGSSFIFGDTLTTDLAIGLSQGNELSSADIQVSYDTTFFDLISVTKAPGFYEDDENVSLVYNDVNGIVNISLAAGWPLNSDDNYKAVRFGFLVQESFVDTTVLIEIPSVSINEDDYFYTDFARHIFVNIFSQNLGDVSLNGEISSYDASLILQYLVGNTGLSTIQLWNGDVSGLEGTTAYDASLIQQYMVGLIDIFPADTGSSSAYASGTVTMEDQEISAGMQVAVPLLLTGGENILSFEKSILFNTDHLTFIEVEWSDELNDFLIESNVQDGELQFAGSGSLPDGQEGLFATIHFVVNEDFEEEETTVTLHRMRWNEESILTDAASAILTNLLSTGDGKLLPNNFALHQNYPNPFNPITQIRYDLPEDALVSITIYDIMGRSIKSLVNSNQTAGYRSIRWDGKNNLGEGVSAGMYIYSIQAGKFRQTKKMVLLK